MQREKPAQRAFSVREAAQYLGVSKSFLDHGRLTGSGPQFFRIGAGRIRYRVQDLDRWLDGHQRFASVAEEAAEAATTAKPARKRGRRAA